MCALPTFADQFRWQVADLCCAICRQNPYADFAYDGVMINPFEVLFVKVKSYQRDSDWITSKMAVTYDRWRRSEVTNLAVAAEHNNKTNVF